MIRRFLAVAACMALAALPACVSPKTAEPVAQHNARAVEALGQRHTEAMALVLQLTDSLIEIRGVTVRGDTRRELRSAGYVTGLPPDAVAQVDELEEDFGPPPDGKEAASNSLINQYRRGEWSEAKCRQWLIDYVHALNMSNGQSVVDALLGELPTVSKHNESAAVLRAAVIKAVADDAALAVEAGALAQSLVDFTHSTSIVEGFADQVINRILRAVPEKYRDDVSGLIDALYPKGVSHAPPDG